MEDVGGEVSAFDQKVAPQPGRAKALGLSDEARLIAKQAAKDIEGGKLAVARLIVAVTLLADAIDALAGDAS